MWSVLVYTASETAPWHAGLTLTSLSLLLSLSSNRVLWDCFYPICECAAFWLRKKKDNCVCVITSLPKNDLILLNDNNKMQTTPQNRLGFSVPVGWARLPYSLLGKHSSVWLGLSVANNSPPGRLSVWKSWLRLRRGEESVMLRILWHRRSVSSF